MPQSVDASKPGLMTRSSIDKVIVDWQNQSSDLAPISFTGNLQTSKHVDCVLVFDESDAGASFVLAHGEAPGPRPPATLLNEIGRESLEEIIGDDVEPVLDMFGRP
jgi:hypothetical protein